MVSSVTSKWCCVTSVDALRFDSDNAIRAAWNLSEIKLKYLNFHFYVFEFEQTLVSFYELLDRLGCVKINYTVPLCKDFQARLQ